MDFYSLKRANPIKKINTNIKEKTLRRIKDERIIACVHTDFYNDSFVGYVIDVSDELLLLDASELGESDGIHIFRNSDITRIRWGNDELKIHGSLLKSTPTYPHIDISSIKTAVRDVQEQFGYVTVHTQELDTTVCFVGEVAKMDDASILLHEFASLEHRARNYVLLLLSDITRIDADGHYERQLMQIGQCEIWRQGF